MLSENKVYIDVLVLNELLYISKKKHNVPYDVSIEFIESIVLPYVEILPLRTEEFREASGIIKSFSMRPSDALHAAVILRSDISRIVSEDIEFDKIKELESLDN